MPAASGLTGIAIVRSGDDSVYPGRQGGEFGGGISAESVGAQALCLHLVRIPAHSRGTPHRHAGHESAIYVISGQHEIWYGPDFSHRATVGPGDFVYIPADTPHLPVTRDEPVTAVVARTDPREQEGVRLLALPPGHPLTAQS
ncbi:MAG: cupin domain-containing protein [Mycobacteriaceae bacterium]|nr:cupin domain-containing protein [Mycobacteriaceae bacterium]